MADTNFHYHLGLRLVKPLIKRNKRALLVATRGSAHARGQLVFDQLNRQDFREISSSGDQMVDRIPSGFQCKLPGTK